MRGARAVVFVATLVAAFLTLGAAHEYSANAGNKLAQSAKRAAETEREERI